MTKPALTLLACLMFSAALAQPGSNDPTFNPADSGFGKGDGFDGAVLSVALQPDGKILAGGTFTSFNGTPRNRIARLHADGSPDAAFSPGTGFASAGSTVAAIALQPDGDIVLGGDFSSFNETARKGFARLHADGSLDAAFDPGSAFAHASVSAIVLQPDGKTLAGGAFTFLNDTLQHFLIRLHADGSPDTAFSAGFDGRVYSLALQPDGKILAAGWFRSFNGTPRTGIARLHADGSLDTAFDPGTGFEYYPASMVLQPDGKILAGGNFVSFNGTVRNFIARLNTDGSLDASFNPGTGFDNEVYALVLLPDGNIIAGGSFSACDGTPQRRLSRLDPYGSLDAAFDPGARFFLTRVYAMARQPDGKIVAGGIGRNGIMRLNANGVRDAAFNPGSGFDEQIHSLVLQPDGKILAGGEFTSFHASVQNRITRLNADGSSDAAFDIGAGFDETVRAVALQPDGKVLAAGSFTTFDGTPRGGIARLHADGSLDAAFDPGTAGFEYHASALALQPDGKIVVGGAFRSFNGTPRNGIARLHADGWLDAAFHPGTGANDQVTCIALQPDGKIVAGGLFTSFNGMPRRGIVRLRADGQPDTAFNPGAGFNGPVYAVALQLDGKIVVGGWFTEFDGTARNGIARLHADGSLDAAFAPILPEAAVYISVTSLALQPDGDIVAGGGFTFFNGAPRSRIARLHADGSPDAGFDPGTGFDGLVRALALQSDGNILAGGAFTSYNGIGRNRIVRLKGGSSNSIGDRGFGAALQAYPNPADDQVQIELGDAYAGVQAAVRNLAGQLLRVQALGAARTADLDLGGLPDGIYLIEVSARTGERAVLRIVKR
ncbi:MAG: T9SS type A sorting domain-containing protein [Bacteroidia bacterium]|nr:T9SS type A sorting domain-containing protein [Bacteroidia bacterium]